MIAAVLHLNCSALEIALKLGSLLAMGLSGLTLTAQTTASLAPPPAAAAPAASAETKARTTLEQVKQPVSWLTWGADLRLRNEYFNSLLTLDPNHPLAEQDYFRFRGRLWASLQPVDDLSAQVRLAAEPRVWMRPAGYSPYKGQSGLDWTEGVFDSANLKWRNALTLPATLTVGRQDLMLGDGWLVLEGTPNDGSATIFLDAARFTYELREQHTTVDAIGIVQYFGDDQWLPTLNNQNRSLGDQNETGAMLLVANKSLTAVQPEAYFVYKHDTRLSGAAGKYGDNADIFTVGGRVTGLLGAHWKYSAEGAGQFGNKQDLNVKYPAVSTEDRALQAFGFHSKVSYLFQDRLNSQLSLAFEYLSGDDPDSEGDEMFDLLWGRWPRWSEIGLYSYAAETRVGQAANLYRLGPGWSCAPVKDLDLSAYYYALFAAEQVPTREASAALFSHDGHFRGHFVQAVLKYKFNPHLAGHLWGECLFPGDYYVIRDAMPFLRAEATLTF